MSASSCPNSVGVRTPAHHMHAVHLQLDASMRLAASTWAYNHTLALCCILSARHGCAWQAVRGAACASADASWGSLQAGQHVPLYWIKNATLMKEALR